MRLGEHPADFALATQGIRRGLAADVEKTDPADPLSRVAQQRGPALVPVGFREGGDVIVEALAHSLAAADLAAQVAHHSRRIDRLENPVEILGSRGAQEEPLGLDHSVSH